MPGTKQNLNQA